MKVINQVTPKWERVATRLYFEHHDIMRIRRDCMFLDAPHTLFVEWLDGQGRRPVTWETLIEALTESDLSELAADLRELLTFGMYCCAHVRPTLT